MAVAVAVAAVAVVDEAAVVVDEAAVVVAAALAAAAGVPGKDPARLPRSPAGYDPYHRFAAALIASAITAARKIEGPGTHATHVSALKAIAWLTHPGDADQWFDMAGFEHQALTERLPLERWIELGREALEAMPELRRAIT